MKHCCTVAAATANVLHCCECTAAASSTATYLLLLLLLLALHTTWKIVLQPLQSEKGETMWEKTYNLEGWEPLKTIFLSEDIDRLQLGDLKLETTQFNYCSTTHTVPSVKASLHYVFRGTHGKKIYYTSMSEPRRLFRKTKHSLLPEIFSYGYYIQQLFHYSLSTGHIFHGNWGHKKWSLWWWSYFALTVLAPINLALLTLQNSENLE